MNELTDVARRMFAAAVAAVQPDTLVRRLTFTAAGVSLGEHGLRPAGKLVLVALGKGAPGLAAAFLRRSMRAPDVVFVLAPDGVSAPASLAPSVRRASHPLPDERGERESGELLDLLAGLSAADGVVLLLSGGSSALLAKPLDGVERPRVTAVTRALMARGAGIHELNTVRKHLLAAAGGRLAAACPAPIHTLVLSDVPGDDPSVIASGPTVPDPTTFAAARGVLARRGLDEAFSDLVEFFREAESTRGLESPKHGDPRLGRSHLDMLGTSRDALEAAADVALEAGLTPRVLTRTMRGEARRIGDALGGLAAALTPGEGIALLLAGETTVTVEGEGTGGRNLELALGAAVALAGVPERCVLAAGTDGVDGSSPAAGACIDGSTLAGAVARGRDAELELAANNSWGFFAGLPEAIVTGPTGTNVADLAFVLAAGAPRAFLAEIAVRAMAARLERGPLFEARGRRRGAATLRR